MITAPRPRFARDFPASPALDALVDAFAQGDYARVRAEAAGLARSSDDEAVKLAARMLVERTQPDPLVVGLLVFAVALLIILAAWSVVHGRPPPRG